MRNPRNVLIGSGSLVLALAAAAAQAGIVASQVIRYTPGNANSSYQKPAAALGAMAGDTSYGALTPFNPAFSSSHLVIVGAGGALTLKLSSPVGIPLGEPSQPQLGVFVNNGIVDVSGDGSGKAGDPATTFSAFPQALLSISSDGVTYSPLDGNTATSEIDPFIFANPNNFYTDTTIVNYFGAPGTQPADPFQPFTGHLSDFDGKTYAEMLTLLDGSAGGNWIDLSAGGLSSVQYVKFDVPDGANYRLVLDAVTAVPEPAGLMLLVGGLALVRRRRIVK